MCNVFFSFCFILFLFSLRVLVRRRRGAEKTLKATSKGQKILVSCVFFFCRRKFARARRDRERKWVEKGEKMGCERRHVLTQFFSSSRFFRFLPFLEERKTSARLYFALIVRNFVSGARFEIELSRLYYAD